MRSNLHDVSSQIVRRTEDLYEVGHRPYLSSSSGDVSEIHADLLGRIIQFARIAVKRHLTEHKLVYLQNVSGSWEDTNTVAHTDNVAEVSAFVGDNFLSCRPQRIRKPVKLIPSTFSSVQVSKSCM